MAKDFRFNIVKGFIYSRTKSDGYNWRLEECNEGELTLIDPPTMDIINKISKIEIRFCFSNHSIKEYHMIRECIFYANFSNGVYKTDYSFFNGDDIVFIITDKQNIINALTSTTIQPDIFIAMHGMAPNQYNKLGGECRANIESNSYIRAFFNNIVFPATTKDFIKSENDIVFNWKFEALEATIVQTGYTIQASYDNVNWFVVNSEMDTSTEYKPRIGTFKPGVIYWRVKLITSVGETEWSDTTSFTLFGTPTLQNLTQSREFWEQQLEINWRSMNQTEYEYELYQNNNKIGNGTGAYDKRFFIAPNTFTGKDNCTVRVRVCNTQYEVTEWSSWQEISLRLQDIEATITNLLVSGDLWEKTISLSWQSTNQQQFKLEVFKNNTLVKTYTGTTETQYEILPEQLSNGVHVFKLWVGYKNRIINSQSKDVNLKNIVPTISNLMLSGSNIDLALILNWNGTDQQRLIAEIWKDDVKVKEYTGDTKNGVTIPPNTLSIGLHKFKVKIAYKDRWTEYKELNTSLVETLPSIGVLWPDGVLIERDEPLRIWWTSQNQSKWKLSIDNTTTYTGVADKERILVAGVLQTGKHKIQLTVTYVTAIGIEKHTTKSAEFIVQGKPPTPTIIENNIFTTSRPSIRWDTQDQQGYLLELLQNTNLVYSTDWCNGLAVEHKVKDYLTNGDYTLRIKTMNQYGLESDWGTKQITINAVEDTTIGLSTMVVENSVQLAWNNENSKFTHFYIIRNDTVIGKTEYSSYIDYTAHKECVYCVRGITATDVYKDSNRCYAEIKINRSVMATIDNLQDTINVVVMTPNDKFSASLGLECNLIHLAGREHPVAIFGEHSSNSYNLKLVHCDDLEKFITMYKRRKVFCYRDNLEKIFFTIQSLPYSRDSIMQDYQATITATQVDYLEVVEYD